MKPQAVRDMAERMYVHDNRTYKEIAVAIGATEKTVWSWGNEQNGRWEEKRDAFIRSKKLLHEELYTLVRKLAKSLREDIEAGREPAKARCDLFKNLTASIKTTREYEVAMAQARSDEESSEQGASPEQLIERVHEVFGVSNQPQTAAGASGNDGAAE